MANHGPLGPRIASILALLALLAQACSSAPAGTPAAPGGPSLSVPPTGAAPTTAPTAAPTTNVGERWTDLEAFPEAAYIIDGVAGDGGWVVAGFCTESVDCTEGAVAGALN